MTQHLQIPFLDLKAQYAGIRAEIQAALEDVFTHTQFVGGPWVEKFEEEFARFVDARFAIGVGSGTAALELAMKVLHIGHGDDVIVPTNSFFATAEAVSNVGARPVFADVVPKTFHLDLDSAEQVLTSTTKAVIPVHLYGRAMDLTGLLDLARKRGLHIIEDAAQAHGAQIAGVAVGASGRLTCFSFYPAKNLGAYGEAGAITTNDPGQAEQLRMLRDHGSLSKYDHRLIGTNSRLDAIQAAVLCVKLRHLSRWNCLRQQHAQRLAEALSGKGVIPPQLPPDGEHVFHLFVVRTPWRRELQNFLQVRGVGSGIHYPVPLHLTPAYQNLSYPGKGSLPIAERLADEVLSLPIYAELTQAQLKYIVDCVSDFYHEVTPDWKSETAAS